MINQTISHYRITGRLGSGGMGVVYEAEDLTLGRKVALKFLPANLSRERSALDRFLLEARAASALNHPNICTIYAVEKGQGADGEEQSFIAMELLEGQNLDQKLLSGALPTDRLLDIAIQLADVLDAAHAKGIIHRDIKPANIFLTPRGQVKVLDFGLAKLTRPEIAMETIEATQDSPTPAHLTSPGATVGTISYMSPEQARGEELDPRTDLFSLGTVLYQMSTGKLPFTGATSAMVFQGILQSDPAPVQQLNPALPPKLQEMIEKLLEKDRDLRYQSAADLRGDLKRLKRDLDSGKKPATAASGAEDTALPPSTSSQKIAPIVTPPPSSSAVIAAVKQNKAGVGVIALVMVIVLAAAGYGVYSLTHGSRTRPFENFSVTKITDSGNAAQVAISPDGKYVLTLMRENGLASLQLRNVPTNSMTQVQPPANVQYNGLRFSPDGNYFYFVRSDPGNEDLQFLYRAPLLGGAPEKLAEDVDSNVTLSPDGRMAAFIRDDNPKAGEHQLIVKDLQSEAERPLVTGPQMDRLLYPAWSPDGKVIVCFVAQPKGALTGLDAIDAQSGQRKPLLRSESGVIAGPEWLPDGASLLALNRDGTSNFQRNQIVRVSYPGGVMAPVTRDAGHYSSISMARTAPVLAAVASEQRWDIQILNAAGEVKSLGRASEEFTLAWTPDGKLLTDKDYRLGSVDPESGAQAAFGSDPGVPEFQQHACRDQRLVFSRYSPESAKISVWIADSSGQNPRKLTDGFADYYPECSPDLRWAYYQALITKLVMRVPLEGGTPQKVSDLQAEDAFDISPDGTSVVLVTLSHPEGHKEKVLEVAVDSGQVRREIALSKPHLGKIQYAQDGKALEYVVRENGVDNIWRQPLDGSAGKFVTAFKTEHISAFRWSPDGKRLALARGHTDSDVVLLKDQRQ
jgi:eukaryotic-like serine/threonine-protein kinase